MRVSSTGQGVCRQRFRPGWPGGGSQVGCMRQATLSDLWRCQLVWPWVEPTNLSTFKSCLSGARVRAGEGRRGVGGLGQVETVSTADVDRTARTEST